MTAAVQMESMQFSGLGGWLRSLLVAEKTGKARFCLARLALAA